MAAGDAWVHLLAKLMVSSEEVAATLISRQPSGECVSQPLVHSIEKTIVDPFLATSVDLLPLLSSLQPP